MKNFKKGFTLIELLVVIAVVGILSSIIMISISSASKKSKISAFKKEINSAQKGLINRCDGFNITQTWINGASGLPNYSTFDRNTMWPIGTPSSCGVAGAGTFTSPSIPATNGSGCSGVIRDTGVTITGC